MVIKHFWKFMPLCTIHCPYRIKMVNAFRRTKVFCVLLCMLGFWCCLLLGLSSLQLFSCICFFISLISSVSLSSLLYTINSEFSSSSSMHYILQQFRFESLCFCTKGFLVHSSPSTSPILCTNYRHFIESECCGC